MGLRSPKMISKFHYVSIKMEDQAHNEVEVKALNSTMFLLRSHPPYDVCHKVLL